MKVNGQDTRPIWWDQQTKKVKIIDQRALPHKFIVMDLLNLDVVIMAIKEMCVRGAPLIGVTAAWGMYIVVEDKPNGTTEYFKTKCMRLKAARPTAVNLAWAADQMLDVILKADTSEERLKAAFSKAEEITAMEVENCRKIGEHGLPLIEAISQKKEGDTVNILTHCNAGWLACVEYGTATAPIYAAYEKGIDVHVWVDETRPLNQGARLTAWELGQHGIKHTVIVDNAGGHLMQHGMVDLVLVGTDRTTYTGDVANKIGTYLKALAAADNNIPFFVALPSSTFDWDLRDGLAQIPIEDRDPDEIRFVQGELDHETCSILIPPPSSPAKNYAFDVTPARLVTAFITERGCCKALEDEISRLFPKK